MKTYHFNQWGTLPLDFLNQYGNKCRSIANTGSTCEIYNFDTNSYYFEENRVIEKLLNQPKKVEEKPKEKKKIVEQPKLF